MQQACGGANTGVHLPGAKSHALNVPRALQTSTLQRPVHSRYGERQVHSCAHAHIRIRSLPSAVILPRYREVEKWVWELPQITAPRVTPASTGDKSALAALPE